MPTLYNHRRVTNHTTHAEQRANVHECAIFGQNYVFNPDAIFGQNYVFNPDPADLLAMTTDPPFNFFRPPQRSTKFKWSWLPVCSTGRWERAGSIADGSLLFSELTAQSLSPNHRSGCLWCACSEKRPSGFTIWKGSSLLPSLAGALATEKATRSVGTAFGVPNTSS